MFTYQCNDFTKVAIELEIITRGTAVISDAKERNLHGAHFLILQLLSLTLASSFFLLLPLVSPWLFSMFWYVSSPCSDMAPLEEVHSNAAAPLHCQWSVDRATHTDTWPRDRALKVLWASLWVGTMMKILSQHILLALQPWPLLWMGTSLISLFFWEALTLREALCTDKLTERPLLASSRAEDPHRQRQNERPVVLALEVLSW